MAQRSEIGRHRKGPAAQFRWPIGRVGALAVALGVGVALSSAVSSAVAHAEDAPNTAQSAESGGVDTVPPDRGQTSGIAGGDDGELASADPVAESADEDEPNQHPPTSLPSSNRRQCSRPLRWRRRRRTT